MSHPSSITGIPTSPPSPIGKAQRTPDTEGGDPLSQRVNGVGNEIFGSPPIQPKPIDAQVYEGLALENEAIIIISDYNELIQQLEKIADDYATILSLSEPYVDYFSEKIDHSTNPTILNTAACKFYQSLQKLNATTFQEAYTILDSRYNEVTAMLQESFNKATNMEQLLECEDPKLCPSSITNLQKYMPELSKCRENHLKQVLDLNKIYDQIGPKNIDKLDNLFRAIQQELQTREKAMETFQSKAPCSSSSTLETEAEKTISDYKSLIEQFQIIADHCATILPLSEAYKDHLPIDSNNPDAFRELTQGLKKLKATTFQEAYNSLMKHYNELNPMLLESIGQVENLKLCLLKMPRESLSPTLKNMLLDPSTTKAMELYEDWKLMYDQIDPERVKNLDDLLEKLSQTR